MNIRLLFATPDPDAHALLHSLVESSLELTCIGVSVAKVSDRATLLQRVEDRLDDVILLDWPMAGADTPELVSSILARNPKVRVVALLPLSYRQYRQLVWNAGACNSIPKEHMDQEWLSSILCVMYRAMQREAKLVDYYESELCRIPAGPTVE